MQNDVNLIEKKTKHTSSTNWVNPIPNAAWYKKVERLSDFVMDRVFFSVVRSVFNELSYHEGVIRNDNVQHVFCLFRLLTSCLFQLDCVCVCVFSHCTMALALSNNYWFGRKIDTCRITIICIYWMHFGGKNANNKYRDNNNNSMPLPARRDIRSNWLVCE